MASCCVILLTSFLSLLGCKETTEQTSRKGLSVQTVDATPCNALIRQCFPGRSDLFGCARSKPSPGSVPADLTLASDLAFVFNASRDRRECCVDPLRPPRLSGHYNQPQGFKSLLRFPSRDWRLMRGGMAERTPEEAIIPSMPVRLNELLVLMRCLKAALESESISEGDKTVVREIMRRINLFAERQGAWWDKLE